MEAARVHHDVRELITETDSLSRRAHSGHREREAEVFASLRTSLLRLDRWLGGQAPPSKSLLSGALDVFMLRVRDVIARAPIDLREAARALAERGQRLRDEVARPIVVAKLAPVLFRFVPPPLPLRGPRAVAA